MTEKQILAKLRQILDSADIDTDGILNRKRSTTHHDEVALLLAHVSLLVVDLRFDKEVTRRELFSVRGVLEDSNDM